jgi:glutathionylspermidine synthase
MRRMTTRPRPRWQQIVAGQGLTFHSPNGAAYWDESVYYEFSLREVETIERATAALYDMCLRAAEHILRDNRFADLAIPSEAAPVIRAAWEAEPPSIYGRFDLAYNGSEPPKLLEFNADTPTSLLEAAVIQWYWLKEIFPHRDQFNSIHEKLVEKWRDIRGALRGPVLYFTHVDDDEDFITVSYLRDTAEQAGISTAVIAIEDIGWHAARETFTDLEERPIRDIFKLYPWEWMLADFRHATLATYDSMNWIEPIWKMLWSNKGLLAVLWEMFPDSPYLLETYLDGPRRMTEYVRKPLLSREGANVRIQTNTDPIETGGGYGKEGYVYQAVAPIPNVGGHYPILGSWVVTDFGPAGMGIRESDTRVTDTLSRFVCHCINR